MIAVNPALAMPYPGLRPFEAEDQPLFFGREEQVGAMLRQLEDHRFVAVVGSSGSGKSSLVRAGLLPAVREGFLFDTTDWLMLVIKPGHQPYLRLLRALHAAAGGEGKTPAISPDEAALTAEEKATLATLRRTDRGLLNALDELGISAESKVIVVVDQFEELFAFRRAGVNRDSVASRDEAAAFVSMLLRTAAEPEGRVWAVLTMRSDFIGDCEAFLGLPEQISRSQFLVPRPDRGQMEEAITRPASVEEGAFKTFAFEEGLVNRIINEAGDRPDQFPLMQHALMRTWKRAVARAGADGSVKVTAEDYERAGGIENALSLHADAAWDEIKDDPKKAHIAQRLFLLLCDISPDGQITRRRPQMAEVQAVTGASVAEIEQVVRVFQHDDRNFLLPPPPQSLTTESYLDISHEALLRQWRIFAGKWQEEERRDASELRRLAELASLRKQGQDVGLLPARDLDRIDRWKQRVSPEWARRYVTEEAWDEALAFVEESQAEVKRDEAQRQKQEQHERATTRAVALILIIATGISIFAAVFSFVQRSRALDARNDAKIAATNAEEAKAAAQKALTRSFVRTIGVTNADPTADECQALWELAELSPANASVRVKVIDQWFQGEDLIFDRALKHDGLGLHAAVGLHSATRRHLLSQVGTLADRLTVTLEKTPKTATPELVNSGQMLAALVAQMEPAAAAPVAARGAQVLAAAMEDPQGNDGTGHFGSRVLSLLQVLNPLISRMEPRQASHVADRAATVLFKALENPQQNDLDRHAGSELSKLGDGLAEQASRLEPAEATKVANLLAGALEKPPTLNGPNPVAPPLLPIAAALTAFAARLEPFASKDGEAVAARGAQAVVEVLEKAPGDYNLPAFSRVLDDLESWMEPKAAAGLAARGAWIFAEALANPTETPSYQVELLGTALATSAARMDAKDAANVADFLAGSLEKERLADGNRDPGRRLPMFGTAIAALGARWEAKDAARVAARSMRVFAQILDGSGVARHFQIPDLSSQIAALAAQLDPAEAKSIADSLVERLSKPEEIDGYRRRSFGPALAALAGKMTSEDAANVADSLAALLASPQEASRIPSISMALVALAARTDSKDAARVAARICDRLAKALDAAPETESNQTKVGSALAAWRAPTDPENRTSIANPSATKAAPQAGPEGSAQAAPETRQRQLETLDGILLAGLHDAPTQGEEQPEDRKRFVELSGRLSGQDLAEVLKWPLCVGDAQKLTLAALEKKTGGKFDGDLWKFVEQAPSLGIKDLDAPAKRPRIEDAIEELKKLRAGSEDKPGVPSGTNPN